MVVRELRRNPQLGVEPIGFLDDDPAKQGKRVQGVAVVGRTEALKDVVDEYHVSEVIIAMPTAGGEVIRALSEACRQSGALSRIVPGVFELLDGQLTVSRLRQIDIADLLRRDQIVSRPGTSLYLARKRVLVTGAGGSIGSELCRQIALANPASVTLLGHGENSIFDVQGHLREHLPGIPVSAVIADIRDPQRLAACFEAARPQIVFNGADRSRSLIRT
jgi:FlaA1/EpsC-like NDP-sugar epimerase